MPWDEKPHFRHGFVTLRACENQVSDTGFCQAESVPRVCQFVHHAARPKQRDAAEVALPEPHRVVSEQVDGRDHLKVL